MCDSNVTKFSSSSYLSFPHIHCSPFQRNKDKSNHVDGQPSCPFVNPIYIHIFLFSSDRTKYISFFNLFTSMAKLFIVIAFLLFTLSFARTPLTQPENDITHPKPESDANLNQLDKESQHVQDLPEPKAKRVNAVPLTFVQLRPINRHFRIRSRHPFRLCHHHNHHHAHNLKPRTHLDQIPYGKDMIHSSGENSDFENVMVHEDMPELPGEWISFLHHNHHHHDDDDDDDDDDQKMSKFLIKRGNHNKFAKLKLKRQFYDPLDDEEDEDEDEDDKISAMQHEDHHSFDKKKLKKHFHNHHEEQEAEQENEAHKEEKKTGGFMKRIRKFLDPYLD